MSDEAVRKIMGALADASEVEATAVLSKLGVQGAREPQRVETPRTPLPAPRECPRVRRSEIEWV